MSALFTRFIKDEGGATAVEYALMAASISLAVVGALAAVGDSLSAFFERLADALAQ